MKETCSGPLRPTMYTFLIVLVLSNSSASSVISVCFRIFTGVSNILATSRATLPRPTITAESWVLSLILSPRYDASGWPL